ncbi:hypothetical protein BDZ97DRAFT_1911685 [Flammula alnicola]|nr:hypothetical protein BDZ97DRAFT_1911685 [Flammula alnicola]
MTDEITPQTQPPAKKDEKKPSSSGSNRGLRGRPPIRPTYEVGHPAPGLLLGAATRKFPLLHPLLNQDPIQPLERGPRVVKSRSLVPSASHGTRNSRDQGLNKQSSSPAPAQSKESSDALSSLQRVIADLKTTSPIQPPAASNNSTAMPSSQGHSTLPPHAPIFQPGAAAYPGPNTDQKHRKAVSLGNSALSGNFNSFSPHLGL